MFVKYYADDGTEFETEAECLAYEKAQQKGKDRLLNEVHALDINLNEVIIHNEHDIAITYYVSFDTIEAAKAFDEILHDYYGYVSVKESVDDIKVNEVYKYNNHIHMWEPLMEMIKYYQNIIDRLSK